VKVPTVKRSAQGFFITKDGQVMESFGKYGVITNFSRAHMMRGFVKVRYPHSDVRLVAAFRLENR
jgi:hypothetical protein